MRKLEAVLENLLTPQAATTGSNIANVPLHTGLSTADVTEDLIFALVESAEESPSGNRELVVFNDGRDLLAGRNQHAGNASWSSC